MDPRETVFALLDDAEATPERPSSRLCTGFVREHRCTDPASLDATCAAVRCDLEAGRHGVLLADYEWGAKLMRAGCSALASDDASSLRVLIFDRLDRLDSKATAAWLAAREGRGDPGPAGVIDLQPEVSRADFDSAIEKIHAAIADGETYQVNYTYRLHGAAWGDPVALYRRLRARQRVGYGALIRLPMQGGDRIEWVLSRSPELFVRHQGGRLSARPMKGTAPRTIAPEGDSETARWLHGDDKNRAENVMIVDLLRNDLGRISRTGSVRVTELFAIEPYATVFQMTSTIEAERRADVDLAGMLRALFPCGSITGAPKHRTMEWIAALERSPRGLYTGAIGWLARGDDASCPDLCLSVAIRTLGLGPATERGLRPLTMGVGGGIVHDSVASDEYDETLWKARFLTALDPGFALFETMRWMPGVGIAHRRQHRARIEASALALGFAFDAAAFDAAVDSAITDLETGAPGGPHRLRAALAHDGRVSVTHARLAPLPPGPVRLVVAPVPLPAAQPLTGHKTTLRAEYDAGIRAAEAVGAFDTVFFGADGQLVEGGRSTIFLRLDGRWFTPRLADGALPGVMRRVLLDDPGFAAQERRLTRADLDRAEAIVVCNALRGARQAVVVDALQPVAA